MLVLVFNQIHTKAFFALQRATIGGFGHRAEQVKHTKQPTS